MDLAVLLKNRFLNAWSLFALIVVPSSLVMLWGMLRVDVWNGPNVSSMIQLSVRFAVPWLFLTFAASSLQVLFPGAISLWIARNRKYLGLIFAAGMAWQGFFILWMVTVFSDYYVNEVYVLRDAIEGVIGYLFLIAMTITSFMPVRRHMKPQTWKLLHKSGIYFLWAYAFSTYWWSLYYYEGPVLLDYVFYWAALVACVLRIAAWTKKRLKKAQRVSADRQTNSGLQVLGLGLVTGGLVMAALVSVWFASAESVLYGYSFTAWPEKYLPYWPFEPFLPLLLILGGGWLIAKAKTPAS
ncbi:MAG: hypothetical protein AAF385_05100 [Pseudomonadota bacterium]